MTARESDVRYARSGEGHIAYDVLGDGPIDIVHVPGILTTIEAQTTYPPLVRFHDSAATSSASRMPSRARGSTARR
jgi:hypothetical protein